MTAFEEMGVLPEIAQAVEDMEWTLPTDVQAEAVPLILGGGDVLMNWKCPERWNLDKHMRVHTGEELQVRVLLAFIHLEEQLHGRQMPACVSVKSQNHQCSNSSQWENNNQNRLIDVAIKEVMLLEACQLTGIGTTNVNRTNFKMADGQGRNTSVGYIILDLQFI
ncbi:uncharacterized protein LOC144159087 isoform X2 [Haemaphysalis longicornis]